MLIGEHTFPRRFVRYEIVKSLACGKGQFGVGINWIKDKFGEIKLLPGENPFRYLKLKVSEDGKQISFFEDGNDSWLPYRDLPNLKNRFLDKDCFGKEYLFSEIYRTYGYVWNDGQNHFSNWVERAATEAGR